MSASPTTPFPGPRVAPHAFHALGGIWRLASHRFRTVSYWLVLLGMLAVLVVLSIPAAPSEVVAQKRFLPWAAGFYGCFLVPILSFITAAGALRDDLGAASVDYVLTRPVRRPLYVIFRYAVHVGVTQISFLFALGVVVAIGLFWNVAGLGPAIPRLLAAQFCGILVFSALGFLCGLLTSRYVIVGLLYGAAVEIGLGGIPTQLNQVSLIRHLLAVVQPALGDGGWAITRSSLVALPSAAFSVLVLCVVAVAAVALTAIFFSRREFAGSAARDL